MTPEKYETVRNSLLLMQPEVEKQLEVLEFCESLTFEKREKIGSDLVEAWKSEALKNIKKFSPPAAEKIKKLSIFEKPTKEENEKFFEDVDEMIFQVSSEKINTVKDLKKLAFEYETRGKIFEKRNFLEDSRKDFFEAYKIFETLKEQENFDFQENFEPNFDEDLKRLKAKIF